MSTPPSPRRRYGRLVLAVLFGFALYPLSPYTAPLFMGAVLCAVGWHAQRRLENAFHVPRVWAALLHALAWLAVIALPTWLIISTLITNLSPMVARWRSGKPLVTVPPRVAHTPVIGHWLASRLHRLNGNVLIHYLGHHSDLIRSSLTHVWVFLFHILIASFVVFSLALKGETVAAEINALSQSLWGPRGSQVLALAERSARSVMIGIIGVGVVEGVLIGGSYGLAGMPMWPSWLVATVLLSAIPFGAGAILAIVCGWLMLTGHFFAGLLTAIWGIAVITGADLALRPLVTGKESSVPFIGLLLSILGGAKVFGLVGVIAGPFLLMLATSLWQAWLREPLPPPSA